MINAEILEGFRRIHKLNFLHSITFELLLQMTHFFKITNSENVNYYYLYLILNSE